jgi:hypothetical protein
VERDAPARLETDGQQQAGSALLDPLAHALTQAGLTITDCHAVTPADVAALHSSWARKLGIPQTRPAWSLTAQKSECF